jgi:(1->4)-alpha-D-glucan 1-alpha-D-glucosylmutase
MKPSEGCVGEVRPTSKARIPASTYRLQLGARMPFAAVADLVGYLDELGITDCYVSPIMAARSQSEHGYDVVDPGRLNPEIGSEDDFCDFAGRLVRRGMGLVLDVVPNHLCVATRENRFWWDVLEHGPSSPFARYFDIDWRSPAPQLENKVLLPVLGDSYGKALENQQLCVAYQDGGFVLHHGDSSFPITPHSFAPILQPVLDSLRQSLGESHEAVLELESIMTAIAHLPHYTETDSARAKERRRETELIKRRIHGLATTVAGARAAIDESLRELNGRKGLPQSFDTLDRLLGDQPYRLSFWRVAADEINYRRFFDINELAAIRVEEPPVFAAVHELALRFIAAGHVTGLRIDHVDGLFDPEAYLRTLSASAARARAAAENMPPPDAPLSPQEPFQELSFYIVVEKILSNGERLRPSFPVQGTTGYEFLHHVNSVFVQPSGIAALRELYAKWCGSPSRYADVLYECKKLILQVSMSSELHVLARKLDRISEQSRYSRDFTLNSLTSALGEIIACFPVYRTYIGHKDAKVSPDDRRHIEVAVRRAQRRNPATSATIFHFIRDVLLLSEPDDLKAADRAERRDFVARFQQLTSPVMAKGQEDTAFYRYYPLASLCEVGGDPQHSGTLAGVFHAKNQERLKAWPHALSTTTTHDTKRSEDVRARLNVLSEIPGDWEIAIAGFREHNREKKTIAYDAEAPDPNEEYLLYQVLAGTLPPDPMTADTHRTYVSRIEAYMNKALKEAKVHTSWIAPDEEYDRAVRDFIHAVLRPDSTNRFYEELLAFVRRIARPGMYNSLSQLVLKATCPGVPDFYQGTELWDDSLVDPDNRRPVDFEQRMRLLAALAREARTERRALARRLLHSAEDGRIKLHVMSSSLCFRRDHRAIFDAGAYVPIRAEGDSKDNVIAFARQSADEAAVVATGRFFTRLGAPDRLPIGSAWGDGRLELEGDLACRRYRERFTEETVTSVMHNGVAVLWLSQVFAHLPVAILERLPS